MFHTLFIASLSTWCSWCSDRAARRRFPGSRPRRWTELIGSNGPILSGIDRCAQITHCAPHDGHSGSFSTRKAQMARKPRPAGHRARPSPLPESVANRFGDCAR